MFWWFLACTGLVQPAVTDRALVEAWRPADPVPALQVVDHRGRSMRLDSLRGRPTLVGFVFTRCGNEQACPLTMRRLVSVQEAFPAEALRIAVFTIDPAWDTPERMATYAQSFGAELEGDRWLLATGDVQLLREDLPSLFNVYALGEGPATSHPVKLTLLDAEGRIAADWDDDEPLLDELRAMLATLATTP